MESATDGGSEDESTEMKERKERHAAGAIADVARQGEKESKEEKQRGRRREREGGVRGGGWPFDEHGGSSMDVRRAHGVTHVPHLAIRARASSLIK